MYFIYIIYYYILYYVSIYHIKEENFEIWRIFFIKLYLF